jgi:helitron helicase-like protein
MLHTTVIYARKLAKRHQLFGQIVRFGIPAIWFIINPSDLKNPVVLRVDIHPHMDRSELNRLRRLHAIGNPTIVAQYFHFVVDSFFKKLLCTDSGKVGILGEISNHFARREQSSYASPPWVCMGDWKYEFAKSCPCRY